MLPPKPSTPGIYIQEIPTLPPSVAEVETAIPAFVGYTEKADGKAAGDLKFIPTKISSFTEFTTLFGNAKIESADSVHITVKDLLLGKHDVRIETDEKKLSKFILYHSLMHFFDNGGGACYMVSVGGYHAAAISKDDLAKGLAAVQSIDEVTLLAVPECCKLDQQGYKEIVQQMIKQAASLKDRFAIIDPLEGNLDPASYSDAKINEEIAIIRQSALGPPADGYAAAYYPALVSSYTRIFDVDSLLIDSHTPLRRAPNYTGKTLAKIPAGSALDLAIKTALAKVHILLPPSGAIAGVYALVDRNRGVWKAPANVALTSVLSPAFNLSQLQQEGLNIDYISGKSINVIRHFTGKGTLVWGARTLNGNDMDWRYINVRRFLIMLEESLKKSIQWAAFEPNTATTWVKVKAMIDNYLYLKWRAGAFAGSKPEEAYFVNIGLGLTMTTQDILEGRMIVEMGMAVTRPAEFIMLRISQLMQHP